jgi:hypothetical protein
LLNPFLNPSLGETSPPDSKLNRFDEGLNNGFYLRTSARVQRMKEERKESESDSEHFQLISPSVNVETPLIEISADTTETCLETAETNAESLSKQKRPWEQWSSEDKALFFEALNEHGKNFEAIHVYFQTRCSKPETKNKEKVCTCRFVCLVGCLFVCLFVCLFFTRSGRLGLASVLDLICS